MLILPNPIEGEKNNCCLIISPVVCVLPSRLSPGSQKPLDLVSFFLSLPCVWSKYIVMHLQNLAPKLSRVTQCDSMKMTPLAN